MSGKELLEYNPLVCKKIKEWVEEEIKTKNTETIPSEFLQSIIDYNLDEINLGKSIDRNPRFFFDLFDDNNVIIEIILCLDKTFYCKIRNETYTNSWKTRKECEKFALENAFKILEKYLNLPLNKL